MPHTGDAGRQEWPPLDVCAFQALLPFSGVTILTWDPPKDNIARRAKWCASAPQLPLAGLPLHGGRGTALAPLATWGGRH